MTGLVLRRLRADPVLTACLAAALLLKAVLFVRVADLPLRGDEVAYRDAGCALANLVRDLVALRGPDSAELARDVVGSGWFMPGMGIVLAPLYLVAPAADDTAARLWLGLVSAGVLVLTVLAVRRSLGRWYAVALCAFPALVPVWALLSWTAYGDLLAGLVLVLLLVRLVEVLRAGRAGEPPTLRDGLVLGFLAITVVHLRSSAALAVGATALVAPVVLVTSLHRRAGRTALKPVTVSAVAAGAVFAGLLLPWSVGASVALDDRVITTTSVPTALANTFGDRSEVCFGPCDPGSTVWFAPVRYAREVARATGHGEVTVLDQMSEHARRDVTARSYAQDVVENFERYRAIDGFGALLKPPDAPHDEGFWQWVARDLSLEIFGPVSWLVAAALLVVSRRRFSDQALAVLLKVGLLALLTQPFVHLSGSRYWTTAGALGGLAVVVLARTAYDAIRRPPVEDGDEPAPLLTALQWTLSAATVATVGVVATLAG
ncbi:hypothetical protein DJ010_09215 [Nocardioides silvaticus]|uniref:Glycosyltransferase RgtA/B/C/D-like domain-containing protein n=1 Tax=Nocardioides silvaticus TaxID=2201891 RepID=A0A316TMB5_9ACTN|nr:hypothetical protein [Nocardioides silvaticus]PWN03284.1 hypothetical protein DJ010_09215 [Nocardioides silvaticus]